jgi:hypothetical protein
MWLPGTCLSGRRLGLMTLVFSYAEQINEGIAERVLQVRNSFPCSSGESRNLFAWFASVGPGHRFAGFHKAGRNRTDGSSRWMDSSARCWSFREWVRTRSVYRAEKFRDGQRGLVKRAMVLQHPPRQQGSASFINPLVHQNRNFTAQIRRMI